MADTPLVKVVAKVVLDFTAFPQSRVPGQLQPQRQDHRCHDRLESVGTSEKKGVN
jgi:hypothetical protein